MKYIFALVLATLLAACDVKKNEPSPRLKMNSLMKTHCIGRSVINLPDGYILKSGVSGIFTPDQAEVEDANIDLVLAPGTNQATFDKQVAARHAELAAGGHGTTDQLTLAKKLDDGASLFRVQVIDDAYRSEIHFRIKDDYLVASISSYNNQVLKSEALLLDFIRRIESVSSALPDTFCFGDVAIKGTFRSEFATLHYVDPDVPDIIFSADIDTYVKDSKESLLQRLDGPNSLLKKFNVGESVIRKGERTVAGMRAQEWIGSVKLGEDRDQKQLGFNLETMRSIPSPSAPKIHFEMEVKGARALDEKSALLQWDAVTASIRPR